MGTQEEVDSEVITLGNAITTLISGKPFIIEVTVEEDLDFTIPINSDYEYYSYSVYTNDIDTIIPDNPQTGSCQITFSEVGSYEIKIKALAVEIDEELVENAGFPAISFANTANGEKLTDITSWGDVVWKTFSTAFYGCSNLTGSFTDDPILNSVTNMYSAFRDCTNFNGDVSSWDVRNVTDMVTMFLSCSAFNQNLASWKIKSVTSMDIMLSNSGLSVENYSRFLIGMANYVAGTDDGVGGTKLANTPSGIELGASGLKCDRYVYGSGFYTDAISAKAYLIGTALWLISDDGVELLPAPSIMSSMGNIIIMNSTSVTADIYYTLDGSEPNSFDIEYISPFVPDPGMTVKAVLVIDGENVSNVGTYDVPS